MNEETEVTTTPQPVALRGNKKKAARDHCIEALAKLNRYAEPRFDLGLLPRTDLPDAEWSATMQRVLLAVAAALRGDRPVIFANCPKCGKALEAESPDVVVANLVTWQKSQPAYFQWSPFDLRRLLEHLHAHPGHVILPPAAAHSVTIRRPDGGIYSYRHDGKVT
jgi:hypothetical protein